MASGNNKERADTRTKPEKILSYDSALKLANEAEAAYLAGRTTTDVDELKARWKNAAQELFASACNLKVGFRKNTDTARNEARVQDARERLVRVETGAPLMGSDDVEIVEPEPVETDSGTVAPGPKENKLWESWGARAKSVSERIKNAKWDKAAEVLAGAATGFAVKSVFSASGGFLYAAGLGALAGTTVALVKEGMRRRKEEADFDVFNDEFFAGLQDSLDEEAQNKAQIHGYDAVDVAKRWAAQHRALTAEMESASDKDDKATIETKLRNLKLLLNRATSKNDNLL